MNDGETYDVTGISEAGDYVPLLANAPRDRAKQIAADYSHRPEWSTVQVKVARTRQITDTYVDGMKVGR